MTDVDWWRTGGPRNAEISPVVWADWSVQPPPGLRWIVNQAEFVWGLREERRGEGRGPVFDLYFPIGEDWVGGPGSLGQHDTGASLLFWWSSNLPRTFLEPSTILFILWTPVTKYIVNISDSGYWLVYKDIKVLLFLIEDIHLKDKMFGLIWDYPLWKGFSGIINT